MDLPLWQWSAADLAQAIKGQKLSSHEVVEAHLTRIKAVNDKINAITVLFEEEALNAARDADQAVAHGEELGPLHGVPMTVKENIDLAGSATSLGVVAFKGAVPSHDAPHIAHLKDAGAIPIGRTNMPDFALRLHTENDLRGATRNPWDFSKTPGGSSGGDAAALATGMTPLGMGNDYAGSLRYPAQCCGITAIRPTFGRVPNPKGAVAPAEPNMTVQLFKVYGPMARHTRDLRLALAVMSQGAASDPWWAPVPSLGSPAPGPVKVALVTDPGGQGVDPTVADGVRKAASCLAKAGYIVEEVDPPSVEEATEIWRQLVATEVATMVLPRVQSVASTEAITFLNHAVDLVPNKNLASYLEAWAERYGIARKWSQFQEQHPLVLGPVSTQQPFEVGYDLAGPDEVDVIFRSLALTVLVNLLGLPSVAVPVQVVDGLPQGVQLIAPRYHEDLCLAAAEVIEQEHGPLTPIDPENAQARAKL